MIFDKPTSFAEAIISRKAKALMPTNLSSDELSRIPAELRERALFSARVNNASILQRLDEVVESIINPQIEQRDGVAVQVGDTLQSAKAKLRTALDSISYEPPEGKEGTIESLSSDQRIDLMVRMQVHMSEGYGAWKQGQNRDVLDMWPCVELRRVGQREVPRGTKEGYPDKFWQERWKSLGGRLYDGRMICVKNSPLMERMSLFGLPYGPPGFNSGYDWRDVRRGIAEHLGVIAPGQRVAPQQRDFAKDTKASVAGMSKELSDELLSSLGDDYTMQDGVVGYSSGGDGRVMDYGNERGNFGHAGRPGRRGGSAKRTDATHLAEFNAITRRLQKECGTTDLMFGHCDTWATEVNKQFPEYEIVETSVWSDRNRDNVAPSHIFLHKDGLFFDADKPQGVQDPREFPFFAGYKGALDLHRRGKDKADTVHFSFEHGGNTSWFANAVGKVKAYLRRKKSGGQTLVSEYTRQFVGASVERIKARVFRGEPEPVRRKLTKLETGEIGEKVIAGHLVAKYGKQVESPNVGRNNFPLDLVHRGKVIEVKCGIVSNGKSAQHWRSTIGQPGAKEKAWLKKASSDAKRKWNEKKSQAIIQRKLAAAQFLSEKLGRKVELHTYTVILNPDKQTADVFEFKGAHSRIVWLSKEAQKGYAASYRYKL